MRAVAGRWKALVFPSLHLAGPFALAVGALGGSGLTWFFASRAHSTFQAARGLRIGWVFWLIGLAGLCEDNHESRELVVPVSLMERVIGRLLLGTVLSAAVAAICSVLVLETSSYSVGTRLIEELVATHLVTVGLSGLARRVAPAGLAGVSVVVLLVVGLGADILLPSRAKIWPGLGSAGFRSPPTTWLAAGTTLIATSLLWARRETLVPVR